MVHPQLILTAVSLFSVHLVCFSTGGPYSSTLMVILTTPLSGPRTSPSFYFPSLTSATNGHTRSPLRLSPMQTSTLDLVLKRRRRMSHHMDSSKRHGLRMFCLLEVSYYRLLIFIVFSTVSCEDGVVNGKPTCSVCM